MRLWFDYGMLCSTVNITRGTGIGRQNTEAVGRRVLAEESRSKITIYSNMSDTCVYDTYEYYSLHNFWDLQPSHAEERIAGT